VITVSGERLTVTPYEIRRRGWLTSAVIRPGEVRRIRATYDDWGQEWLGIVGPGMAMVRLSRNRLGSEPTLRLELLEFLESVDPRTLTPAAATLVAELRSWGAKVVDPDPGSLLAWW